MVKQLATTYKLVLLGKPDVIRNGVSVKIPRSKCKGIIFYLASQDKDVSRDKLQDFFWPELKQQTAQHNLNVHLSDIRKHLPGLLESDNAYVRLSDGIISIDLQHDMGKVQLFDVFANLFLSIASFSPLLVVVDDIGCADMCTLKLIEHLAVRCSALVSFAGSISTVYPGTRKPVISARLRSMGILRRITMPGFTAEDVSKLLKEKYPAVSDELVNWLWEIAGRNPFQLIELANSLPEKEFYEDKTLNITPSIPASLRDYFEPVSAMLSETARLIIDIASAYGTVFNFRLIAQTGIVSGGECMDALDELIEKGILIPAGNNEYEFFTAIIRETVYAVLNPSRRQWLHLKIAEAIEEDDSLFEQKVRNGLLAHHFAKSYQPKRAVPYAVQAGDDAYKRSAWLDAIDYYEMAKEYADDSEFLLRHLTAVYMSAGEEAEYRRILEAKSSQSRRFGRQGEYLVNEIEARFSKQDRIEEHRWAMIPGYLLPLSSEDMQLLTEAKQVLEGQTEEPYVRARLCMIVALRSSAAGDYMSAAKYCIKIIDEFPEFTVNEQPLVVMAHLAAGVYLSMLGRLEESGAILEKGLALALDKEVIYAEAIIRCEYGKQLALLNKTQEAKKQLDIALNLSRHYRMVYIEARTLFEMAIIDISEKNHESEKLLREALHLTEITNNSQHLQIHILNELFPLLSENERIKWNTKLTELDVLDLQK